MTLPGVLFVIFMVLKLVGVISWSWWWVTSPLWISMAWGLLFVLPAMYQQQRRHRELVKWMTRRRR